MPLGFTHLLFDLDETLLDFHQGSWAAFKLMCERYQLDGPEEAYQVYNVHNADCWAKAEEGILSLEHLRWMRFKLFLDELGLRHLDPVALGKSYLHQLSIQTQLVAGAVDSLSAFAKTHKLAIITNGLREVQRPRLQKAGLTHYFEEIFVSDEIGLKKPQRAYFDHVLKALGNVSPKACLVIGDGISSDILGAQNAGIASCLFNYRKRPIDPLGPQPTFEVGSHQELQQLLQR